MSDLDVTASKRRTVCGGTRVDAQGAQMSRGPVHRDADTGAMPSAPSSPSAPSPISAATMADTAEARPVGVVAVVDDAFGELTQVEAARRTNTSSRSRRNRVEAYSPAADESDVVTHRALYFRAGEFWTGAGTIVGAGWLLVGGLLYDAAELGTAPVVFGTAGACWAATVAGSAIADIRARRRYKRFSRDHPDILIKVPSYAVEASDRFIASATQLQKMDLPDSARAQIADARVVLNRLMATLSDLDADDIHTSDRLVAEIERLAVEAEATLDVARRRHDIIKGLDPDALIAAAGTVSLYDAALDIVTEHKHIEQVLGGAHKPHHIA